MEVRSTEKRKLGKFDVIVPAMNGTIARMLKILSILALVAFVFISCEIVIPTTQPPPSPPTRPTRPTRPTPPTPPTSLFTNQSSSIKTGVVSGENIVVSVQGSGSLVLSGTCNFAEITVQSSGGFNGSNLEIRRAEVNNQGSGHTYVWATNRLNVKIQGSGNVYYKGNPQISSNISGSGKLIKM